MKGVGDASVNLAKEGAYRVYDYGVYHDTLPPPD